MDDEPVRLQRRYHRSGLRVQLGASVKQQAGDRGQDPGPHHTHCLAADHERGNDHGEQGDHADVLEQVAPREAVGSQAAQDHEHRVDCDGQPDHGLGDSAELVGAVQGLGDTLGAQALRQLCLEGGEVGLDVLARNLTGIGNIRVGRVARSTCAYGHLGGGGSARGVLRLQLLQLLGALAAAICAHTNHSVEDQGNGECQQVEGLRGAESQVGEFG